MALQGGKEKDLILRAGNLAKVCLQEGREVLCIILLGYRGIIIAYTTNSSSPVPSLTQTGVQPLTTGLPKVQP